MQQPPDIALDDLRPILRELDGAPEPVALTPLHGGSTKVWRIDLAADDPLVLKTYPNGMGWSPRKEAYAASLLQGLDLPVTRYRVLDETKTKLPVAYAIASWLPGEPVRSFIGKRDLTDIYRAMGALIRRLHTVRLEAYGYITADGIANPRTSNADAMRDTVEDRKFRDHGGDADLAHRLEAIVTDRAALFTHSTGPVFAHDDVQQSNVLAARDANGALHLSGLIDFGNVRAADPVYDLAKCIFCAEHEDPTCRAAMLEGYGPIPHPEPEAALRLYTLIHRMMMWWWLRHIAVISADEPHSIIDELRKT
ncbi:MAG TPA: aminoglycoside phosphotransferase family protein [Rhizomicrobium sp.]|jgi:aminoglycoside phosphotransferase (APT) family kinase protein|nr:aminoglycoside phosphotransferase family protein [Rhizomicrobium sp.]